MDFVSNMYAFLDPFTDNIFSKTLWTITILILVSVTYWYMSIPKDIPPGPVGLPFLGYLPFLGEKPYLTFNKLAKKYGNVFSFYLGSRLVIVLNDYTSIKEAFVKQAENFSGRPIGLNLNFFRSKKETKSISMTDGDYWKEHRRFLTHFLRDCGMGKSSLEPLLMEEVQRYVAELKTHKGRATDFTDLTALSVCNNVTILAFGRRFDYDDPWFLSMKNANDSVVSKNVVNKSLAFPWVRHIPGIEYITNQPKLVNALKMTKDMLKIIKDNEKTYIEGSSDSYVSAYLNEQKRRTKDSDTFSDDSLVQNIRTLMSAGTETTANTILWAIIYMMLYPEIQRKVQKEIDEVIGSDQTPTWAHRTRTPYVEATIYEIQRMSTLVPLNVPHRNRDETTLFGYRIPKSTFIISNLYNVQNDPTVWKSPHEFRPEHFLDKNGAVTKPEQFTVFSLGKRVCLGEPLARVELYLYFTTLLQHFNFEAPNGIPPSTEVKLGLTLRPKHFITCAIPRNE